MAIRQAQLRSIIPTSQAGKVTRPGDNMAMRSAVLYVEPNETIK